MSLADFFMSLGSATIVTGLYALTRGSLTRKQKINLVIGDPLNFLSIIFLVYGIVHRSFSDFLVGTGAKFLYHYCMLNNQGQIRNYDDNLVIAKEF